MHIRHNLFERLASKTCGFQSLCRLAGALLFLSLASCAQNPVTGKQDFVMFSEDKELALGRQYHPQIIKENFISNENYDIVRKAMRETVLSGSGKSSLAFDTLYAEGQRRYVESLSSYARQFLGRLNKPKVDYIKGIAPAIAIEQKVVSKNPRSTVGTVTSNGWMPIYHRPADQRRICLAGGCFQ